MKKRYLMIVEKAYVKNLLQKSLESVGKFLTYDLDIVVANTFIVDVTNKVLHLSEKDLKGFEAFCLKNRVVPPHFMKVKDNEQYYKTNGDKIMELVSENSYDCIINGCDADETGHMIFDYTIESLGLDKYPIKQICIVDYSDESIKQKFLSTSIDD